jgi:hypothetical protein
MSKGSVWLTAAVALVTAAPASAQIRERVNEARQRPSVDVGVGGVPGRPDASDRRDRGDQRGEARGNDRGDRRGADRGERRGKDRGDWWGDRWGDRYDDWRSECRFDGRHDGRSRDHDWYGVDGRWDCRDAYRENRYPARYGERNALSRGHYEMERRLEVEHERWHRSHGWYPRNRGWERSHAALHARLERNHDRWHRQFSAPYVFWFDRPGISVRAGVGVGIVLR